MLRILLSRLAALTALTFTTAYAGSGCTALYSTMNYGTTNAPLASIDFVNTVTRTTASVFDLSTAIPGMTSVNASGLNPVSGQIYFIDRTGSRNDLYAFNPVTRAVTFKGAVPLPNTTNNVAIGGTFDNTTGTARYFVLYASYTIQEINPETGALIRTLTVTFPSTDASGQPLGRRSSNGVVGTSGDLVFDGPTAYAVLDGNQNGTPVVYWVRLGNIGSIGTTTATVTPTSADVRRINDAGGTAITQGSVVGASITPFGESYISYTPNGVNNLALLDTTVATTVTTTNVTLNGTRIYTDLSDCTVLPDTPTITKTFSPIILRVGETSTLTLTLASNNPSPSYLLTNLTDTFPAGVVIANTPNLSTTCVSSAGVAPAITAAAGSGSVTIPAGTRVPHAGAACTVTLTVTKTSSGLKTNLISANSLNTTAGKYGVDAQAVLFDPVSGTNTKQQRLFPAGALTSAAITAKPGAQVEYCLTAVHAGGGSAPATAAVLSDTLSANLTFVKGSASEGYGVGQDLKITRNGGAPAYQAYTPTLDNQNRAVVSVSILPFDITNKTVQVCFVAKVK